MKKKRNLYIIAFLCFITLVGVTIAYLGSTSVLENIFEAGTYKTITHEEFTSPTNWTPGDETPKTITTKNEGTMPVMVRVKLEEEWTSKNDTALPIVFACNGYDCFWDEQLQMSVEKVAIINLDNESDWIYKDGYYYYTSELDPGETTSSLIKSVTFNPNVNSDINCTTVSGTVTCESTGNGYDGATYKLKITTETVQAKNYETIWEDAPIMYDYVGDNPCTYNGDLVPGAEFVSGQYTYRFRQSFGGVADPHDGAYDIWYDLSDNGWGVKLTNLNSTDPVTTSLCSSINNKPITSMSHMFDESKSTVLDLSSFDTSNVTHMDCMFAYTKATTLDLSSFDTSNVTDMSGMFMGSQATSLDLSSFDTSKVTNMWGMFSGSHATTLDLRSFDTSNVEDMSDMFYGSQFTTLDLSSFDTSKVTNMWGMFRESQATTLDLSSFDTSNVTNMSRMFWNSQATSLDLSSFDTSKVVDMSSMFQNAATTTGYARTQADADKFNSSSDKPSTLTFVVKGN